MTWHVCVYHRVTGNSIYNFEEKANRKMDEEKKHTTWKQIIVHHRQRGREEEKEERKKEVGRVGGRRKRQGMGGAQSREKMKDVHLYTVHIV